MNSIYVAKWKWLEMKVIGKFQKGFSYNPDGLWSFMSSQGSTGITSSFHMAMIPTAVKNP